MHAEEDKHRQFLTVQPEWACRLQARSVGRQACHALYFDVTVFDFSASLETAGAVGRT